MNLSKEYFVAGYRSMIKQAIDVGLSPKPDIQGSQNSYDSSAPMLQQLMGILPQVQQQDTQIPEVNPFIPSPESEIPLETNPSPIVEPAPSPMPEMNPAPISPISPMPQDMQIPPEQMFKNISPNPMDVQVA